jgi:hypothetical protein
MCLLRCVYFFLLCLQLLDLFSPQKRIDALNRLQLCWTIVVDSEFVESPQSLIYYFRQAAFVLLSLRGFSYDVYCCSLGLLVEVVLPAFCQQH